MQQDKKNMEDAAITMGTEHALLRDRHAEISKSLNILKECAEEINKSQLAWKSNEDDENDYYNNFVFNILEEAHATSYNDTW